MNLIADQYVHFIITIAFLYYKLVCGAKKYNYNTRVSQAAVLGDRKSSDRYSINYMYISNCRIKNNMI
jgi:hypothetical protein